ncbi:MAG: hypothetical protein MJZ34_13865 [Paludibacteraceae bacterium]|nr:hypothetical protein [Paludibacteraceae bacterium]
MKEQYLTDYTRYYVSKNIPMLQPKIVCTKETMSRTDFWLGLVPTMERYHTLTYKDLTIRCSYSPDYRMFNMMISDESDCNNIVCLASIHHFFQETEQNIEMLKAFDKDAMFQRAKDFIDEYEKYIEKTHAYEALVRLLDTLLIGGIDQEDWTIKFVKNPNLTQVKIFASSRSASQKFQFVFDTDEAVNKTKALVSYLDSLSIENQKFKELNIEVMTEDR